MRQKSVLQATLLALCLTTNLIGIGCSGARRDPGGSAGAGSTGKHADQHATMSRKTAGDRAALEAYVKMRWPVSATLAPDNTFYYVFNPDGISQLYALKAGESQDKAVKLTSFPDGIGGYEVSEDGKWVAMLADVGGNENDNVHLMNAADRKVEPLLTNPKAVFGSIVWRRDSRAFAYRANDESPADFHVYLFDMETRTPRKLMSGQGHFEPADFNRDGTKLVVTKAVSATHSQLFEINVTTGESREITPAGEAWSFEPIGYNATDTAFLVNTNYRGDLMRIHSLDLSTGALTAVLPDLSGFEVDGGALNTDRTVLAVAVNQDGFGKLHLRRASDFSALPVPPMSEGVVGNVRFQGRHLLFALDNAQTPGLIYQWDMNNPSAAPVALTSADTQGIDVAQFPLPKLVHYPSFDGQKIPAFLYLPKNYRAGSRIPFLVQYHGGPESQFRPNFNRTFQYFVSRGYGVLAPNIRGSSGYGKAFLEADNYKDRFKSVQDGIWAAKYLVDEGYSEKKRIAAWGGSYGGFMTMAVITEAPEYFGAACNVVGIVNFETFLEQTKDYRRKLREVEYGPLDDRAFLKSISPIYKVDRIDMPLMIAHGLNDPRVPVGEAMQIAVALKKRGMPVEELYFADEGHGFAKEENRLLYMQVMAEFFEQYLK